jgi:nickel-dependent lactate racemase
MSDVFRATIPYESLDPLTIGAADDDSKVYREVLEIDIPQANLLAAIYPQEPTHLPDATAATAAALEQPVTGPRFSELIAGGKSVAIVIDNQFRPTPQSRLLPAIFDALEAAGTTDAAVICANGKVFPMSDADTEMKIGRENLARM